MVLRCLAVVAFAAAGVFAQEQAPPGVLRGEVTQLERWTVEVRSTMGPVYRCGFDNRTYMERDGQRIFSAALQPRDLVEMIADRNGAVCYARTVRVVRSLPVLLPHRRPPLARPYRAFDNVFPRGNLTFAGVVRRLNSEMLVLRTRSEPEMVILLRDDTRYMSSGLPSEFSNLAVNTRVFIRGGQNYENSLEAYQVVWGEIPGPKRNDE